MGFTNGGGFVQATPQNLEVPGAVIVNPGGGTLGEGSIIIQEFNGQAQVQFDSGAARETGRAAIFSDRDSLDVTRSRFEFASNVDGDRGLALAMTPPTVIAGTPTRGQISLGSVGSGATFPNGVVAGFGVEAPIQTQLQNTNDVSTGDNALIIGNVSGTQLRFSGSQVQGVVAGPAAGPIFLQPDGGNLQLGPNAGANLLLLPNGVQAETNGVPSNLLLQNAGGIAQIGNAGAANMLMGTNGIQAENNGVVTTIGINASGGTTQLGAASGTNSGVLALGLRFGTTASLGAGAVNITNATGSYTALPGAQATSVNVACPASGAMAISWTVTIGLSTTPNQPAAGDFVAFSVTVTNITQSTTPFVGADARTTQFTAAAPTNPPTPENITLSRMLVASSLGNPGDSLNVAIVARCSTTNKYNVSRTDLVTIPSP